MLQRQGKIFDPELFWSRFDKTDTCWIWKGSCSQNGYGIIRMDGVPQYTHRIAWALTHLELETELHVLHTCDNPSCGSPDHLFLGTQADNNYDMTRKRRNAHRPGETNPNARLSNATASHIRSIYETTDMTLRDLARMYNVGTSTIWRIIHHKAYK